jgi:hypothetical protein
MIRSGASASLQSSLRKHFSESIGTHSGRLAIIDMNKNDIDKPIEVEYEGQEAVSLFIRPKNS